MPHHGIARPDLSSTRTADEQEELAEAVRSGSSAAGYPLGDDDSPVPLTSGIDRAIRLSTAAAVLAVVGIDLVTMANNHVLDYGPAGLADTLAAAWAARFPYVGIGDSAAAAWAPYLTTIKGVRLAVIGVSQVAELASSWVATPTRPGEANAIDLGRTLAAVRSARRLASVVIVFMHWGTEGQACPDQAQLSLARQLAAAGASIIIWGAPSLPDCGPPVRSIRKGWV